MSRRVILIRNPPGRQDSSQIRQKSDIAAAQFATDEFMPLYQGRRIVTGHDAQGRSVVISDGPPRNVVVNPADPDRGHINFWKTERVPARNEDYADPME